MNKIKCLLSLFLSMVIWLGCSERKSSKETSLASNYELVKNWPDMQYGQVIGQVTGVDVDTSQNIFLIHRAWNRWASFNQVFPDTPISANAILELDRNTGKVLHAWGAGLFVMPHGLTVDHENNIWTTDVALQQIFKFSHDGKLLMTLGEARVPGNDSSHFNFPTDVAVASDGSFYVSDGYRNSRVIKFSKEGKYLFEWGKKGNLQGEFIIPHGIDLDSDGNVYVADRENNRMQIFDGKGKFLKEWKNEDDLPVYSLSIDQKNKHILTTDYNEILYTIPKGSNVRVFDDSLKLLTCFGRSGSYNGPVCRYHDITVDREGNIYVSDILGNRIQKFNFDKHTN